MTSATVKSTSLSGRLRASQPTMAVTGAKIFAGSVSDGQTVPVRPRRAVIEYVPANGVADFVQQIYRATPIELVEAERHGVDGRFLKDLSKLIDIPASRVFTMLGVPKATAEKKAMQGGLVSGSGGQAAIAIAKLLGMAEAIVESSTSLEADGFDSAKWLGQWLERPQPALGARKPADLMDTPTGVEVVTRLLGALESGAYQ